MIKLIQDCWEILKKNPNLYTPPMLLMIINTITSPSAISASPLFFINLSAFIFINLAVGAGWTNQIKVTLASKEKKSKFDDFLSGIGKYFSVVSSGSIVLILIIGISLISMLSLMDTLVPVSQTQTEEMKKISKEIIKLSQNDAMAYLQKIKPEILEIITKYFIAFFSYISVIGILYFFISLWTQICVFSGSSWFQGWKRSFLLVYKKFGLFTILSLLQASFMFITFMLGAVLNESIMSIFVLGFSIVMETYFAVLFCLFILEFDNDNKVELLTDDIQSPLSKIQKPDNKE